MGAPLRDHSEPVSPALRQGSDAALVARIRVGDVEAFTILFRQYFVSLVRFLVPRLGTREQAEDVVQDVFAQLWAKRANLDPSRSVQSYLYTTARNLAINVISHDHVVRRHSERWELQLMANPDSSLAPAADQGVLADELGRVAAMRVQSLSPRLREIYRLSRHEGMKPAEIADTLGVSVGTIHVQMGRIMRSLYPALAAWLKR